MKIDKDYFLNPETFKEYENFLKNHSKTYYKFTWKDYLQLILSFGLVVISLYYALIMLKLI